MTRLDTKSPMLKNVPNVFDNCHTDSAAMLRDIAYVLQLTRQVKAEILEDRAIARAKKAPCLLVAD